MIKEFQSSVSWRVTAPLRKVHALLLSKVFKAGKVALPIAPQVLRFMNETPEQFYSIGDELLRDLKELAGFSVKSHMLDIGSGYGRLAYAIMRNGGFKGQYTGLEILKKHCEWCQANLESLDRRFKFRHLDIINER